MKKVLFEISGEERNRILEMHQTATSKQYLTEDIGDDEKMLALEIVILIDTITKREDFDFEKPSNAACRPCAFYASGDFCDDVKCCSFERMDEQNGYFINAD